MERLEGMKYLIKAKIEDLLALSELVATEVIRDKPLHPYTHLSLYLEAILKLQQFHEAVEKQKEQELLEIKVSSSPLHAEKLESNKEKEGFEEKQVAICTPLEEENTLESGKEKSEKDQADTNMQQQQEKSESKDRFEEARSTATMQRNFRVQSITAEEIKAEYMENYYKEFNGSNSQKKSPKHKNATTSTANKQREPALSMDMTDNNRVSTVSKNKISFGKLNKRTHSLEANEISFTGMTDERNEQELSPTVSRKIGEDLINDIDEELSRATIKIQRAYRTYRKAAMEKEEHTAMNCSQDNNCQEEAAPNQSSTLEARKISSNTMSNINEKSLFPGRLSMKRNTIASEVVKSPTELDNQTMRRHSVMPHANESESYRIIPHLRKMRDESSLENIISPDNQPPTLANYSHMSALQNSTDSLDSCKTSEEYKSPATSVKSTPRSSRNTVDSCLIITPIKLAPTPNHRKFSSSALETETSSTSPGSEFAPPNSPR